eukprot:SAG11_NODE_1013_length_6187_cov_15.834593_4_plen_82_part_00
MVIVMVLPWLVGAAVRAGHAVAFAGPLRHAGFPITRGCRVILVLFLYVEGWAYGDLVHKHNDFAFAAAADDACGALHPSPT